MKKRLVGWAVAGLTLSACASGDGSDPRFALCDYYYDETLSTFFEQERHDEMAVRATQLRVLADRVDDPALAQAGHQTADLADVVASGDPGGFQAFLWAPLDPECESFSARYRN